MAVLTHKSTQRTNEVPSPTYILTSSVSNILKMICITRSSVRRKASLFGSSSRCSKTISISSRKSVLGHATAEGWVVFDEDVSAGRAIHWGMGHKQPKQQGVRVCVCVFVCDREGCVNKWKHKHSHSYISPRTHTSSWGWHLGLD